MPLQICIKLLKRSMQPKAARRSWCGVCGSDRPWFLGVKPKELAHSLREAIGLFDMRGVPGARDDDQAGVRKPVEQGLRDVHPGHAVVLSAQQ